MFLEKLVTYISDTHNMFTESGGFTADLSWHIVIQLVNHIFVDDMEKVRSFVRDSLSVNSKKEQGMSVL